MWSVLTECRGLPIAKSNFLITLPEAGPARGFLQPLTEHLNRPWMAVPLSLPSSPRREEAPHGVHCTLKPICEALVPLVTGHVTASMWYALHE